ncbi:hypothetical protein BS47DRAFT_1394994 [Hydnum rufescens UP504]|uniref:Uncharacterized protein n=1 Tax=Hydnum rufescens UP504 TaxID=1448309 RepID=A0A9P6DRZ7_9AGAM|nr:hypothetical protein BS47DRAFT_1394994 [Hydnum rufescens UP504]
MQLLTYESECRNLQKNHKREFELSRQEFECIHEHATLFTKQTEKLLKHFKMSTSAMYRCFDLMDLQQQYAMDSARALKDILLHIHNNSFSLDDYYLTINELLRGILTSFIAHFDKMDTCLITFKSDMEGMFHHWNSLAPSPLHEGMWTAKLTSIIACEKEDKHKEEQQPDVTVAQNASGQAEAEGSKSHSKGKEVVGRKPSGSSNCHSTQSRCK